MVTSRRRLTALDEARPLSLDILPVTDAVTLFTRIAGPGRPAGPPDAVAKVVELCGRLPLAVRIAAARLRARPAWTVAHLADRLGDQHHRLGELDDGERGVAAAFTLSYDDLTSDQQRTFRALGLHPGADTDAYAVAALTGLSLARASRTLEELLDAHLLSQTVPGRYRMHDLVRAYAADLARTQDSDDARGTALTGLFDHYLATAAAAMDVLFPAGVFQRPRIQPADSPAPPVTGTAAARAWLDAERPNLVAVCAHAAAHGRPGRTSRLSATLDPLPGLRWPLRRGPDHPHLRPRCRRPLRRPGSRSPGPGQPRYQPRRAGPPRRGHRAPAACPAQLPRDRPPVR